MWTSTSATRTRLGTNENTNGLLRQYFPKGTDLSVHTAADLNAVADELNDRPRKRLGFRKPIEQIGPLMLRYRLDPPNVQRDGDDPAAGVSRPDLWGPSPSPTRPVR